MQSLYNVPFYAPAALAAWGLQPLSEGFAEQRGTAKIFNPNQSSDANSIWLVLDDTVFCNRLPMQTSRASLTALKSYQNFLNNLARQTGLSQLYIFPAYGPPSTLQAELLSNAKLLLRPV